MEPTTKKWRCPHCGESIPTQDINVAANLALCRACGVPSRFEHLVEDLQDSVDTAILDEVPKGVKVEKTVRGLEVTLKNKKSSGAFFIVFALTWNTVIGGFTYNMLSGGTYELNGVETVGVNATALMMLIPFGLVGLGLLTVAIYFLFGCIRLILGDGKGMLFYGVGEIGRRKTFLLNPDTRVAIKASAIRENHRQLSDVVISNTGEKPVKFGAFIKNEDIYNYLVAIIKAMR